MGVVGGTKVGNGLEARAVRVALTKTEMSWVGVAVTGTRSVAVAFAETCSVGVNVGPVNPQASVTASTNRKTNRETRPRHMVTSRDLSGKLDHTSWILRA
jgi:hypothetical protein